MRHHLRKEKICLNCGAEVADRFCSHCGQENLETKESFSELLGHFFSDVTHYDSKFFTTIKDLLFKPGFLTKQYFEGKRTKYLNPLRMYFFISFVFFLVLFINKPGEPAETNVYDTQYANLIKQHLADSLRQGIKEQNTPADSLKAAITNQLATQLDTTALKKDTTETIYMGLGNEGVKFTLTENKYNTVHEYDSVQQTLSPRKRDQGILRWLVRTNVGLKNKYGSRSQVVVAENFEHSIPKLMFVLLPVFAWLVYIFYSRKKFYYTQHAIFSIHFHSFIFLLFLFVSLIELMPYLNKFTTAFSLISLLIAFIYLVLALGNTYGQSIWLSVAKALSISVLYVVILILGLVCLAFISFITT